MVTDKTKLLNEIGAKIQSLNLLVSALKSDRSRKPEALKEYKKKYQELLKQTNVDGSAHPRKK
jgi:hypothetical protein